MTTRKGDNIKIVSKSVDIDIVEWAELAYLRMELRASVPEVLHLLDAVILFINVLFGLLNNAFTFPDYKQRLFHRMIGMN